jgi:lysophospholipase L1-like esterase
MITFCLRQTSSRKADNRHKVACANILAILMLTGSIAAIAQKPISIPEVIEWTWEVRPAHPDAKLPNVLLLGDSISRSYFPEVTKDLQGTANVYLMASSTSVGDPRLPRQIKEFSALEDVHFRVVHFNNGMHGWAYTEDQYKMAFPLLLKTARSLVSKNGALIWASTTPVKENAATGATNPRIDERNSIALAFVQAARIPIDDLHSLMMKHLGLYEDSIHFNPAGATIMGDQAASMIRAALSK